MERTDALGDGPSIGIAGRPTTDQEKSYVRQAVFLLRYRIRFDGLYRDSLPFEVPE